MPSLSSSDGANIDLASRAHKVQKQRFFLAAVDASQQRATFAINVHLRLVHCTKRMNFLHENGSEKKRRINLNRKKRISCVIFSEQFCKLSECASALAVCRCSRCRSCGGCGRPSTDSIHCPKRKIRVAASPRKRRTATGAETTAAEQHFFFRSSMHRAKADSPFNASHLMHQHFEKNHFIYYSI